MTEESPRRVPSLNDNEDASLSDLDLLLSAAISPPPTEYTSNSPWTDASHPTATSTSMCHRKHFDDLYHLLRPDHRAFASPEMSPSYIRRVPMPPSNQISTQCDNLPKAFTVSTTSSRSKRKTCRSNDNKRGRSNHASVMKTTTKHPPSFLSEHPLCDSPKNDDKQQLQSLLLVPTETQIDDDYIPTRLETIAAPDELQFHQSDSQQGLQNKDDVFLNYLAIPDDDPSHPSLASSSPVTVLHASSSSGFRARHNVSD